MGPLMSRFGLIMSTLMVCAILAGCTTTGGTGGSFCDTTRPHRPSAVALAAMNDREVEEMLAHNLFGQKACGWRP